MGKTSKLCRHQLCSVLLLFLIGLPAIDASEKVSAAKTLLPFKKLISQIRDLDKQGKKVKLERLIQQYQEALAAIESKVLIFDADCPLIKGIIGYGQYAYHAACSELRENNTTNDFIFIMDFSKTPKVTLEKVEDLKDETRFGGEFKITKIHKPSSFNLVTGAHVINGILTKPVAIVRGGATDAGDLDEASEVDATKAKNLIIRLKKGEDVSHQEIIEILESLID